MVARNRHYHAQLLQRRHEGGQSMRTRPLLSISILALGLLCLAGYWGSASLTARRFRAAVQRGDIQAIDAAFEWSSVTPDVSRQVSTSFVNPHAERLGPIVASSFRGIYLAHFKKDGSSTPSTLISEGFTNVDEFTIRSQSGNKFVLSRRGVRWYVTRLDLTVANAQNIAIGVLARAHQRGDFNIHDHDLYFDDPRFGAQLTTSLDVAAFARAPGNDWSVAMVRFAAPANDSQQPLHTEIWRLDLRTMTSTVLLKGKESSTIEESTEGQTQLAYSNDGRVLYFECSAWATSDAIFALDLGNSQVRFVAPGNGLYVIQGGTFAGDILTLQHQYRPEPNQSAIEAFEVIDPHGRTLKHLVGESHASLSQVAKAAESL
jgi:hypothetical protein